MCCKFLGLLVCQPIGEFFGDQAADFKLPSLVFGEMLVFEGEENGHIAFLKVNLVFEICRVEFVDLDPGLTLIVCRQEKGQVEQRGGFARSRSAGKDHARIFFKEDLKRPGVTGVIFKVFGFLLF